MKLDIFKLLFLFSVILLSLNLSGQKSCVTDAGTMTSLDPIQLCADDCTDMVAHNSDESLDGDDILQFVVHTGTNPAVPLARNTTPEFCFSQLTGGEYGVTYFISAIAGNNIGGFVNVSDPCYSQSVGTPVVWFETPIAFISETEISECSLETTLEAAVPQVGLTGTWSCTGPFFPTGGTTVNDPTINVISGNQGDYTYTWTVVNGPCTSFDNVLVHFLTVPSAYAGDDFAICGNMAELEATPSLSGSTGQWTGNGSFNPATTPQTEVTAGTYGNVTFTWRESLGICWDEDQIIVTFVEQPNPATIASFDTVCGNSVNIEVLNSIGVGSWTAWFEGVVLNPAPNYIPGLSSPSTGVTIGNYPLPELSRTIDFVWTEITTGGGIQCVDSAEISMTFSREPVASVGDDDEAEVCGSIFELDAVITGSEWASGMWISTQFPNPFSDPTMPDAIVTIPVPGSYGDSAYVRSPFIWAMSNTGCTSLDTMWVTFYRTPVANAGLDNSLCGNYYDLGAVYSLPESSNYTPNGIWSVYSKPTVAASADLNPPTGDSIEVSVSHYGFWEFIFRENNTENTSCYATDTVKIEFIEVPVISAGEDRDVCGQITHLEGIDGGFNGTWLPNGISITEYTNPETMVTSNAYGAIDFVWLESNQFCSSKDTVTITFWRQPSATILTDIADSTVCGLTFYNLRAENPGSGIDGVWYSLNPAITYEDPFDVNTSATVPNYGYHNFYWIESTGPELQPAFCTDTAGPLRIHFIEVPQANAGGDTLFCGHSGYLNAIPTNGTGVWSTPSETVVVIENQNDPTSYIESDVINTGSPTYPFFELIWTEDNTNGCTDKDTMHVIFARIPTSEMQIIPPKCFGEPATIAALEDTVQQYTWNFYGGLVDSISPANVSGGLFEHFIYWNDEDTVHRVSMISTNYWGCQSPINIDTIQEPPIPIFEYTLTQDTCALGKGGIEFTPTTENAFFWIDPNVGPPIGTPITEVFEIPAGEYGIRVSYLTHNIVNYSYYINTFGTANCIDTMYYEIETIGMIDAEMSISVDIILEDLIAPNASVIFLNTSDYDDVSKRCEWHFDDGSIVKNCDEFVEHIYTEAGCYEPFLIVMNRDLPECRDTARLAACLFVDDESKLEIPNVFSPNGDGINDFYQVKAQTLRTFSGQIMNRWGNVVFEWTNWEDYEAGWDGKIRGGSKAAPGVYFYVITAEGIDGIPYDAHGALHLFSE